MIARMMPAVVFFALVLAFFVLLTRVDRVPDEAPRPAPNLALVDFDGKPVLLPKSRWLLVNFFASWCVPCVLEHPQLVELQKTLPVVGISYRDQRENVTAMLKSRGNPYVATAHDKAGEAALAYGIAGVPETFLINPDGQIVRHVVGPIMQDGLDDIRKAVHARP